MSSNPLRVIVIALFVLVGAWGACGARSARAAEADAPLPLSAVLSLEHGHLIALGGGVVVGAVLAGPWLGTSELVGVLVGVIAGELFYRSPIWPLEKPKKWFTLSAITGLELAALR